MIIYLVGAYTESQTKDAVHIVKSKDRLLSYFMLRTKTTEQMEFYSSNGYFEKRKRNVLKKGKKRTKLKRRD